jgi:hypothetical protein
MDEREFEARFETEALEGMTWAGRACDFGRALVQLALPRPTELNLWYAPSLRGTGSWGAVQVRTMNNTPVPADVAPVAVGAGTQRGVIGDLAPGSRYRVQLPGSRPLLAATAPSADDEAELRFLAFGGFCPYGADPGGGVSAATTHALGLLRARAEVDPPAFMLGLGDQVYVDEGGLLPWQRPYRALVHGPGARQLAYQGDPDPFFQILYRRWFGIPPFDETLSRVPTAMMWNDHEIREGWGSQNDEEIIEDGVRRWARHLMSARRHFYAYQMLRNERPASLEARLDAWDAWESTLVGNTFGPTTGRPEFDFSFNWGRMATVMVMDQRSHRNYQRQSEDRVISVKQLTRVARWLGDERRQGRPQVFVLVSPVPLTTRPWPAFPPWRWVTMRRQDFRDAWASTNNRDQHSVVLSLLVDHFSRHPEHRLLVLSGDVHHCEARELTVGERIIGHEVTSSALAQSMFPSTPAFDGADLSRLLGGRLASRRLGIFRGPGFAELSVTRTLDGRPPEVGFLFHSAADPNGSGALLNPTAAWITGAIRRPLPRLQPDADPFATARVEHSNIGWADRAVRWDDPLP